MLMKSIVATFSRSRDGGVEATARSRDRQAARPVFGWLIACASLIWAAGLVHGAEAERAPLEYFIVVTGGELLQGVYPDSHTHFLTRTLTVLGATCRGSICVDDQPAQIRSALEYASVRAALVIVTGGLGPTQNDITRETLAEFSRIPLAENEEVLTLLESRYKENRVSMRPNLRRQALVPTRGSFLRNGAGTSAGLVFESKPAVIVALPGPPRELQLMVTGELIPWLQRRFSLHQAGRSLTVRFIGVGQSRISQVLEEHRLLSPEVIITSTFQAGRVDFTFSFPRDDASCRADLERLARELKTHLGDFIYAETNGATLEQVVLRRLSEKGKSLAIVELGSAGYALASLNQTQEPRLGVSGVVAPSPDALGRWINWGDARRDAAAGVTAWQGSAPEAKPDWVLWIGPVEAAGSGRTMEVALRFPDQTVKSTRMAMREYPELVSQILDWVRRTTFAEAE